MADIVNLEAHYIGSPAPGVYLHQIPNASMQVLEDLINATWNEGLTTKEEFSAKIAAAFTDFLDITAAPHVTAGSVTAPSIVEPTVDIPTSLSVASPTVIEPDIEIPTAINIDVPTVVEPNVTIPTSFSIGTPSVTEPTVTIPSSLSVATPTIVEPAVDIPSSIAVADIWDEWETRYLELADWLVAQRIAFMTTYFPDEQATYEAAENWLQAAIVNPESGLPPAVASQIWGDDQARILSDKARAQDAVVAQFAARRFPLPPGAAAAAVAGIEQKAQEALAESSRKVAILSVDLQKFNVETILKLRQVSMSSVVDYIKALASGPDIASKMTNVGYDIQTKLISAASQFFSARANAAEVVTRAASMDADAKTKLISATTQVTNARTGVAELSVKAESADADAKTKLIGASAQITGARTGVAELEVKAGSAEADAKTKLISSSTQILSARANVADTQVKAAVANAEVKTRLMAGAAQIFDSRIRSAQAVSDVAKHNNTVAFDASVKNQMSDLTLIEDKLKAMLAEAQSIAQVCAAFVNNLHVSASLAANGGTTISQSNEF